MKAILSADLNWGIGCRGKLLQRVPEDMKFFMKMTTGKVVVMGRETLESLPGKQPLKDRVNIVLSKNRSFDDERLIICRTLDELLRELDRYPSEDVFIIGGESVYTQLLPYCSEVYVTRFEKIFEADRHFPNLDTNEAWTPKTLDESLSFNDLKYSRIKYINNKTAQLTFYKQ